MPDITSLDDLTATPHATAFDGRPRTIRLSLDAGEGVAAHSHPGEWVLLHVLEGRLDVRLDDDTHELAAGDMVRFSGDREVQPEAVEDATALVVFAPKEN